jgi:hydrophobe/amphiphile efflux-1 (HAE1) family protein
MGLMDIAVQRIVASSLLALGIVVLGCYSYQNLVTASWPAVDLPTIVVTAALPGASPETMAATVATPLERRLGTLAGVTEISSVSSVGNTQITMQFSYGRDVDGAANDVQSAISAANVELPKEMPRRPVYKKINPTIAPVVLIAITSKSLPLDEVYGYADTVIRQRLSEVGGVGNIVLQGAERSSIRISVDPDAIASLALGFEDIRDAVQKNSLFRPLGSLEGARQTTSLNIDDQLRTAEAYKSLILHTSKGAPLRLSDVALVKEDMADSRVEGQYNGRPAVFVFVQRKPGANIVQTVDNVKEALPAIRRWLPAAIDLNIVIDRADEITSTLDDFKFLLLVTVVLVVILVFVFLRDIHATLIACVSIPVSLCGTFTVLHVMGYGLDLISLLALMLATGFVVDDAVVMVENIVRSRRGGPIKEAVAVAARQIGFTIIAITISLIAAFAPFFFFVGIIGTLLREFATTVCAAIFFSAVVSLTLTPALCARFLRNPSASEGTGIGNYDLSKGLAAAYLKSLRLALAYPRVVLGITITITIVTGIMFTTIPKGFLPTQDSGAIFGITDGSPDVSFAAMAAQQREIGRRLLQDRAVRDVATLVGGSGSPTGIRTARFFVTLKPSSSRDNVRVVIARLREMLEVLPGSSTFMVPIEDINVGAREGKGQYQYTLRGESWPQLQLAAKAALERLRQLPTLKDLGTDHEIGSLQLNLLVDRDKAATLGITPLALDEALFSAFGQRQIALLYTSLEQQQVILEMNSDVDRERNALQRVYLKTADGSQIPLRAVASATEEPASLTITHQGEFPAITLTFNVVDGVALSQAVGEIQREVSKIDLGSDVRTSFEGKAEAFKSFTGMEPYLLLAALAAVYIVLGVLYESYVHPLTILSSLPPAGFGALSALWLARLDLSLVAFIGIILLVGIVKKNAILIVDFALKAQHSGKTAADAIIQACEQRVRPIVMTNAISILTSLPLIFAMGPGSNVRQPLGVAVAGGLIAAQILTLYSTPVIYLYLSRWRASKSRKPIGSKADENHSSDGARP